MKNFYLAVVVVCAGIVTVIAFQNIILGYPQYAFLASINGGILTFFTALAGFIAGGAFILYYGARKSDGEDDSGSES